MTNSVKNFVDLAVAIIKGDDAEAKAIKIQSRASKIVKSQLSAYELEKSSAEDTVEEAKENYNLALVNNGEVITNNESYLQGLVDATAVLEAAEEKLAETMENIQMFQDALNTINKS